MLSLQIKKFIFNLNGPGSFSAECSYENPSNRTACFCSSRKFLSYLDEISTQTTEILYRRDGSLPVDGNFFILIFDLENDLV